MDDFSFGDVGEDFEFAVVVGVEAAGAGDVVFVDYAERAEGHVLGGVVVCEGEGVIGAQPAVVGVAARGGEAGDEFDGGFGHCGLSNW